MDIQLQHVHGVVFYALWVIGPGAPVLGAIWWLVNRLLVSPIKDAYNEGMTLLKNIDEVTSVQAGNHLSTIEANSKRTVEVLEQMHLTQMEMSGYIKASLEKK